MITLFGSIGFCGSSKVKVFAGAGSAPFSFDPGKLNLIYYDGWDNYYLTTKGQESVKGANLICLGVGGEKVFDERTGRSNFWFFDITSLPNKSKFSVTQLNLGWETEVFKVGSVFLGLGAKAGFAFISGNVGKVGYGDNTGASFMYGPNKEYIDYGTPIKSDGKGYGVAVYLSPKVRFIENRASIFVNLGYKIFTSKWSFEAKDRDGKTVDLMEEGTNTGRKFYGASGKIVSLSGPELMMGFSYTF